MTLPPPRVLLLSDIPTPYRNPLLARIARRPEIRLQVLFCARSFSDRSWRLEPPPFPASFLSFRGFRTRDGSGMSWLLQPEVIERVRRAACDVLVVSSYVQPTSLLALATARWRGIPTMLISESHGRRSRPAWKRHLRQALLVRVVRSLAGGFATGSLARQHLVELGLPPDRVFLLPNTPDTTFFAQGADRARQAGRRWRQRLQLSGPTALFVGRLLPLKEVHTLLEAWGEVRRRVPGATLVVAGDGPEERRLRRRARSLPPGSVRMVGFVQPADLPELYAAADLLVLPSRDEPWGVVVNEAMASGLPVVVSDRVGAGPDLVQEGVTGSVFATGDRADLADKLTALLSDAPRAAALGRRARRAAEGLGYSLAEEEFVRGVLQSCQAAGR